MTAAEADEFLTAERTCRVATAGQDGRPHVAPLWFVWDGTSLWLSSLVRSQRWTDLMRDPRVAVVVDAGVEYTELRGVELSGRGRARSVTSRARPRPIPSWPGRSGCSPTSTPAASMAEPDGRHAWLRLTPDKLVSWDFRMAIAAKASAEVAGDRAHIGSLAAARFEHRLVGPGVYEIERVNRHRARGQHRRLRHRAPDRRRARH